MHGMTLNQSGKDINLYKEPSSVLLLSQHHTFFPETKMTTPTQRTIRAETVRSVLGLSRWNWTEIRVHTAQSTLYRV